jgi:hypothetical protein
MKNHEYAHQYLPFAYSIAKRVGGSADPEYLSAGHFALLKCLPKVAELPHEAFIAYLAKSVRRAVIAAKKRIQNSEHKSPGFWNGLEQPRSLPDIVSIVRSFNLPILVDFWVWGYSAKDTAARNGVTAHKVRTIVRRTKVLLRERILDAM